MMRNIIIRSAAIRSVIYYWSRALYHRHLRRQQVNTTGTIAIRMNVKMVA